MPSLLNQLGDINIVSSPHQLRGRERREISNDSFSGNETSRSKEIQMSVPK
jgi:hypothetical protein